MTQWLSAFAPEARGERAASSSGLGCPGPYLVGHPCLWYHLQGTQCPLLASTGTFVHTHTTRIKECLTKLSQTWPLGTDYKALEEEEAESLT